MYPITKAISKQLMPIYDKPMIYYPLSILMMAGIREILIITTPEDNSQFKRLLGDGKQVGCRFRICHTGSSQWTGPGFCDRCISLSAMIKWHLILGDNIFYGSGFGRQLKELNNVNGGYVFAYKVSDPERYGVVEFDDKMNAISIEEKPKQSKIKLCSARFIFL